MKVSIFTCVGNRDKSWNELWQYCKNLLSQVIKYKNAWKTFVTLFQSIPCASRTIRGVSPDFKQEWSGNTYSIDLTWPSNIRHLPNTLPSFCYHTLNDPKLVASLGKRTEKAEGVILLTRSVWLCEFYDKNLGCGANVLFKTCWSHNP